MMTRGLLSAAHRQTTQASDRISFLTGVPPFARLKCRQSGDAQSSPTLRPRVTLRGLIFHTSSAKCSVSGWFAACMAIASGLWFTATSGERPNATEIPSEAPPPPANESIINSDASMVHRGRREWTVFQKPRPAQCVFSMNRTGATAKVCDPESNRSTPLLAPGFQPHVSVSQDAAYNATERVCHCWHVARGTRGQVPAPATAHTITHPPNSDFAISSADATGGVPGAPLAVPTSDSPFPPLLAAFPALGSVAD